MSNSSTGPIGPMNLTDYTETGFHTVDIEPLTDTTIYTRIKDLIETRYIKETERYHLEVIDTIRNMDLKERLFQSLENGYAGFEVARNPRTLTITATMKLELQALMNEKIADSGLSNLVRISMIYDSINLIVDLNKFLDMRQYPSNAIALQEKFKSPEEQNVEIVIEDLVKRVDDLETEVMYRPGGLGSLEALESFNSAIASDLK